MIKALLEWIRINKEGKLSAFFYFYRWFRLNVIPLAYELGIFFRPDRIAGYYALGNLLAHKYFWMVTIRGHDARKVTSVGRRAIECFDKTIALDPECLEAYQACGWLLSAMGKIDESYRLRQYAVSLQQHLAERNQLDRLGIRFLPSVASATTIGAMVYVDAYIKAQALGMRPSGRPILLIEPGHRIHNSHFLNYWRPYITIISDPDTVESLLPLVRYLKDEMMCGKQFLYHTSSTALIYRQWEDEKRPPLLTLSREDYERGWGRLKLMGVPKGAWFVCLHVRESGFKDGGGTQDAFRNADIDTYLLAMKGITARGGWVIRMGNPTMKRLPKMERVIDYAHSDCRSDWMDVFLSAQCRFFINTSSGPGSVAASFGVPLVLTNYMPTCAILYSSRDLFIPKLCWSVDQKRYLTFEELMSPPVSTSVLQHQYDYMNLQVVDNSQEEINDLVTEMLDRFDGKLVYSVEDEQLQEQFKTLTAKNGTLYGLDNFSVNCRFGRDYLRKYSPLLRQASKDRITYEVHTLLQSPTNAIH